MNESHGTTNFEWQNCLDRNEQAFSVVKSTDRHNDEKYEFRLP